MCDQVNMLMLSSNNLISLTFITELLQHSLVVQNVNHKLQA